MSSGHHEAFTTLPFESSVITLVIQTIRRLQSYDEQDRYNIIVATIPETLVKKHCMQEAQTVFKTKSTIGLQEVFDFNKSTGTPVKSLMFQ